MTDYAKQMRENAVIDNNGNVIVSEELWQQIANIIETQQAEIENLKEFATMRFDNFVTEYDNEIKAKAIKEFADRLKEKFLTAFDSYAYVTYGDIVMAIENIVKEMVGAIE